MEREERKEGEDKGKGKEEEGREERRKVSKMGGEGGSYSPGECQLAGWCCHREEEVEEVQQRLWDMEHKAGLSWLWWLPGSFKLNRISEQATKLPL